MLAMLLVVKLINGHLPGHTFLPSQAVISTIASFRMGCIPKSEFEEDEHALYARLMQL